MCGIIKACGYVAVPLSKQLRVGVMRMCEDHSLYLDLSGKQAKLYRWVLQNPHLGIFAASVLAEVLLGKRDDWGNLVEGQVNLVRQIATEIGYATLPI